MKGEPVIYPVHLTATYRFERSDDLIDVVRNRSGYLYSRWDNPSVVEAEKELAALEGTEKALGFGSGMAAITTALAAHVKAGSRIVATRQLYGATFELLNDVLPKLGIETVLVDCWDTEGLLREIDAGVDVLYLESPTNPLLRIVDVPPLAAAARGKGAVVMLDSTFASPVNQKPQALGVDVIVHSATKYIGGHHDITAGFLCCGRAHFDALWTYRKIMGGVMDPVSAFLVQRGLKTLQLRVDRQNESALQIARFLQPQARVKRVHYPGLQSHPDHLIARKQLAGFGGMLSFEIDGDFDRTKAFMDRLGLIKLATSLGGVTSLANQPVTNTHAALSAQDRSKAGISESLVRLSVGVEPVDALIEDLKQALKAV